MTALNEMVTIISRAYNLVVLDASYTFIIVFNLCDNFHYYYYVNNNNNKNVKKHFFRNKFFNCFSGFAHFDDAC